MRPPRPPLFPYTTLFRSSSRPRRASLIATYGKIAAAPQPRAGAGTARLAGDFEVHSPKQQRRLAFPLTLLPRSEEHTSELQSQSKLVCRLLLEKKKIHS